MVLFLFFTLTIVFNLKPSSNHLPRLALLFAGSVILVYLMNEIKMLLLLFVFSKLTPGKPVLPTARACRERMERLLEKYINVDKKALKRYIEE